ncbi:MAG: glycosyltransferase [Pirellulales bacterium]
MRHISQPARVMSHGANPAESPRRPAPQGDFRTLSVLMPIYNERWTLQHIVERVFQSPVTLNLELVAVDDCSTDGSWELLNDLARRNPRLKAFRHEKNQGKGAAIRTAIRHMTGDVAVVQDADLEYDPVEFPLLLAPILEGKADAVFGSRFTSHTRRVLFFWHCVFNQFLTFLSNMLNDLNLTDMETCYKMVRGDVLRQLRLSSDTFTFEPELTCRLAQWGARIYEVPISYSGRTFHEGKKIRAIDGLKALGEMLRCKFLDPQFTHHKGFYAQATGAKAHRRHRWLLDRVRPYLGRRVFEAGAGIGNLSNFFLDRQRLVLADRDPAYVAYLKSRFDRRENVRVVSADVANFAEYADCRDEQLDTVLCANVLECLDSDEQALQGFESVLMPGGHCIVVAPAGAWLHSAVDEELGRVRRYSEAELSRKMQAAGFEVVYTKRFDRLGTLGWAVYAHLLGRRNLGPRAGVWFDRLSPVLRILDHLVPAPASSLIMVGRKRAAPAVGNVAA